MFSIGQRHNNGIYDLGQRHDNGIYDQIPKSNQDEPQDAGHSFEKIFQVHQS